MDRRKQLIIAVGALLLVLAAGFGLSLVSRQDSPAEKKAAEEKKQAVQDACASRDTFQALKDLAFKQAAGGRAADPANFDVLASSAFPRMENPVVVSTDDALGLTTCRGHLVLELPPGAELAFNGEHRLAADVDYEIQASADGSGPVYRMRGAEPIVSRLSAFNLKGHQLQMPDAVPAADATGNVAAPVPVPDGLGQPVPPAAPVEPPRVVAADPSFACDDARTRGEVMICASPRLAAKDRTTDAAYQAGMDEGDSETRRALRRTRDDFFAYRDRCTTEACVSQAYDGRMREIRDIVSASH